MRKSTITEIERRIVSSRRALNVALRNLRGDRPLAALASLNIGIAEALRAQVAFSHERMAAMLDEGLRACRAERKASSPRARSTRRRR